MTETGLSGTACFTFTSIDGQSSTDLMLCYVEVIELSLKLTYLPTYFASFSFVLLPIYMCVSLEKKGSWYPKSVRDVGRYTMEGSVGIK